MSVCFLDFDGCLIINGVFSQAAVKNLNDLLAKEPDLKIIISSSWRHSGLDFVKNMLSQAGIDTKRVVGMTDLVHKDDRGHHITRWVQDNKPEAFVILDDKNDMDGVTDHLVQTNSYIGLTGSDVKKAIDILKNKA